MSRFYNVFVILITALLFACQTTQQVDDSMTTEEKMDALVEVSDTKHYVFEYFFDWKKYNIKADQKAILDKDIEAIKAELAKNPNITLRLEGHADERGTQEYNEALSEKRARAIAAYLIEKEIHVPMKILFYGHKNPRESGKSESAWSKNRRVDIILETQKEDMLPAETSEQTTPEASKEAEAPKE